MRRRVSALKVALRYLQAKSDVREDASEAVTPVNKAKGINSDVIKTQVQTEDRPNDTTPSKDDIRPEDVFKPSPKNVAVRNLADQGWPGESKDYKGMDKTLSNQVPKDKGHATVNNLSQYLIETDGGGGTKPVG